MKFLYASLKNPKMSKNLGKKKLMIKGEGWRLAKYLVFAGP